MNDEAKTTQSASCPLRWNQVMWSDEAVVTLRRMFAEGVALYHIGRAIGLSETTVSKKVLELGLTRKRGIHVAR